jgi:hypothetical protein
MKLRILAILITLFLLIACQLSGLSSEQAAGTATAAQQLTAVAGELNQTQEAFFLNSAQPAEENPPAPPPQVPLPPQDAYIDRVVSFTPRSPSNPQFSNTDAALGSPDFNEAALSGFISLGIGGSITVEFVDNVAVDGPGDDISIFGDPANDEKWTIEVSEDGANFKSFGLQTEVVSLDLKAVGLSQARFIRITDDGDPRGISPGCELDAVMALNSSGGQQTQPNQPAQP